METMKPFDIQDYFEDLGNGWRLNTITGSIFFRNEEIITTRISYRKVLAGFLKKKSKFKIHEFLKKNFLLKDGCFKNRSTIAPWSKWMFLTINRILYRYGFSIEVSGSVCSKKAEWSLCYVD